MATPAQAAAIEARCRFVFNHAGGRFGLTTDGALALEAREAFMLARGYNRAPDLPEWEITLAHPSEIEGLPADRGYVE